MLKKLTTALAAASIAAAGMFVSVPSAEAGTCWYMPSSVGEQTVYGKYCQVRYRVIDGLKVWFVTDQAGTLHRYTFWDDGTVDHQVNGKVSVYEWEKDDLGYRVYHANGYQFVFSWE